MNGGGGSNFPPPQPNGGDYLLSLLQKPRPNPHPSQSSTTQQSPIIDPAVAMMGPTIPTNGHDHPNHHPHHHHQHHLYQHQHPHLPPWSHTPSPHVFGLTHNPFPLQRVPEAPYSNFTNANSASLTEDLRRIGFPIQSNNVNNNNNNGFIQQQQQHQHQQHELKLQFGSLPTVSYAAATSHDVSTNGFVDRNKIEKRGVIGEQIRVPPPPGFGNKDELGGGKNVRGNVGHELRLPDQLDHPGPPSGSNLRSGYDDVDAVGERLADSLLLEDEIEEKSGNSIKRRGPKEKDGRSSDSRGNQLLSQRARTFKRQMMCRRDIDSFSVPFLSIYESLIPPEEEKLKQNQLLGLLEKLVCKEWPMARLYLYGSCASSFGVSKSDIDVCLAIQDADVDKSKIIMKLADILQSDNLQNVQALTRARVPIVKLMDPVTGISCDICINNLLAVVNTKLLRDYANIDPRLRQLAFIIKHWAKSRGVNETYHGTLSSYAYVLMCIHFLQQRRPAILPCLQVMNPTYSVRVDNVDCAFFDQVEKLGHFGRHNKDTIAHLVWGFFYYWAYCHDYANSVISVRTGSTISKRDKDWTRRIGNDRHLICIEDPFETSHDLGRVVDKRSIKVLREEFERAADIMQYDPNPCIKLFEPYVCNSN